MSNLLFTAQALQLNSCTISVNNLIIKELFFIKKWVFQVFLVHAIGLFYKHGSSNPAFQFPHQHWFATKNIIFQKRRSDILKHSRLYLWVPISKDLSEVELHYKVFVLQRERYQVFLFIETSLEFIFFSFKYLVIHRKTQSWLCAVAPGMSLFASSHSCYLVLKIFKYFSSPSQSWALDTQINPG